jgi:hypothetical protein
MTPANRWLALAVAGLATACSIAIQRDLSSVPPGQVGYDDMCGLQEYFDALEIKSSPPPRILNARDLDGTYQGKHVRGGQERFAFENDFQLKHLRRVLNENWRRLPESVATAETIEIEVQWTEKAGTKRVVTENPAGMIIGGEEFELPYHICLSELLYGEPLYRQRRSMWGLPLPAMPRAAPDGGSDAREAGRDGGGAEAPPTPTTPPSARPDAAR